MTVCNMSIEAGAKAGLIAPDDATFAYLEGREHSPTGAEWDAAVADWRTLRTDDDASFDEEVVLQGADIVPHVSWGTNPAQVMRLDGTVPSSPGDFAEGQRARRGRPGPSNTWTSQPANPSATWRSTPCSSVRCTNSRIEDLRGGGRRGRGPAGQGRDCAPSWCRAPVR